LTIKRETGEPHLVPHQSAIPYWSYDLIVRIELFFSPRRLPFEIKLKEIDRLLRIANWINFLC